jgi:hypothetical protein
MSLKDLLRGLPLPAAPLPADLFGHGPVLGDDGLGLGTGDRGAVGVADHMGQAAVHDRPGALGQVGGDHAGRAEVVLAALDHLDPVDAYQVSRAQRYADRHFPRSLLSVRGEGIRS